MDEMFKTLGIVVAGLGGSSVIILGLSSWLGKVWAERIFQKEKLKYEKELQNYKNDIDIEMQRLKTLDEKALYITKIQYEKEFEIYQNIWKSLIDCVWATENLYPKTENRPNDEKELEKYNMDKYVSYSEKYNIFSNIISTYAPFYQKEFYNDLINLRTKCSRLGSIFKMYKFDVKYNDTFILSRDMKISREEQTEVYITLPKEIDELVDKLQNEIRDYLKRLRVE